MTGLLDIAPRRKRATVEISVLDENDVPIVHKLEVQGITLQDIADLLERHPELQGLLGGGETAGSRIASMPKLVAAVIASGMGHPGDEEAEAAAAALDAEDQAELFAAILKLTMPRGIVPFVNRLVTALGLSGEPVPASTLVNGSLGPPRN